MIYSLVIVDDDFDIRNGLTNYFPWDSLGFQVKASFEDGESLLSYLLRESVDIVLCDNKLPGISGLDVAKRMHELGKSVQFVFLSAYSDYSFVRSALQIEAVDYLLKPTNYTDLTKLFTTLRAKFDAQNNENDNFTKVSAPRKIIEAVQTYCKMYLQGANLNEAAEIAKMNPNYLSKFFRHETGMSFSDYLMSLKMERAAQLLEDYTLRIGEISITIGYSDSNNFTRAFTRYYGQSPREYRKREEV
jgi:two-component system, response regulator YesN